MLSFNGCALPEELTVLMAEPTVLQGRLAVAVSSRTTWGCGHGGKLSSV